MYDCLCSPIRYKTTHEKIAIRSYKTTSIEYIKKVDARTCLQLQKEENWEPHHYDCEPPEL